MNIALQKEIARELLHKLEIIYPATILAGGAPRDWWLGKEASDLDFYIHLPKETIPAQELRFKRLGFDNITLYKLKNKDDQQMYDCMEHLHRVWEMKYKGMKVQIMVMTKPTYDCVISKMGTSVCMVWWKGGDVKTTKEFLISHETKTIYKKDDYTAKVPHVEKMKSKFPDYNVRDFSRFAEDCVNNLYKVLKEEK